MWQFGTKPGPSITAYIGEQIRERWRRQEIERLETQRALLARMRGPDLPKPRLRRLGDGYWRCFLLMSVPPYRITTGFGRTPAQAYADWLRRIIATDYTR